MSRQTLSIEKIINNIDISPNLIGKKVVFTGSMQKTRNEVEVLAESIGMIPQKAVSKSTNLIVLGENAGQSKLNTAMKFSTPIVKFSNFINIYKKIQKHILENLKINKSRNLEFVKEATNKFPFLINFTSKTFRKSLITEFPELLKFVNSDLLDNITLAKLISENGKIFFLLPQDRKGNLNLIEAALFAKQNPQITLCKKLMKVQIDVLNLDKASKEQKEYIWNCYKRKLETDDVMDLAKSKKDLIDGTISWNSLKRR